jgi:hypothetical protein
MGGMQPLIVGLPEDSLTRDRQYWSVTALLSVTSKKKISWACQQQDKLSKRIHDTHGSTNPSNQRR